MDDLPPLTLLLGPQTAASLALNTIAREFRKPLGEAGVTTLPSRVASPLLRRCLDDRPLAERRADLDAEMPKKPAFLSAVNFFGPPEAGLSKRELFPDAEIMLAGLAELTPRARIVLAADPLPEFFLAAGSDTLEARVRRTGWEDLYELSWADLVREVSEMVPGSEVIVLTGKGVGASVEPLLKRLFGGAADALPGPHVLLRPLISETGHAVLDRMSSDGPPENGMLAELYTSFADRPSRDAIRERLTIDKVTRALLDQRFEEDLAAMATMGGVEVV